MCFLQVHPKASESVWVQQFPLWRNDALNPATKAQKHQIRTKFSWDFVAWCFRGNLKRELLVREAGIGRSPKFGHY